MKKKKEEVTTFEDLDVPGQSLGLLILGHHMGLTCGRPIVRVRSIRITSAVRGRITRIISTVVRIRCRFRVFIYMAMMNTTTSRICSMMPMVAVMKRTRIPLICGAVDRFCHLFGFARTTRPTKLAIIQAV